MSYLRGARITFACRSTLRGPKAVNLLVTDYSSLGISLAFQFAGSNCGGGARLIRLLKTYNRSGN
jgi:hypothetical protein